jgi:transposase-like protein
MTDTTTEPKKTGGRKPGSRSLSEKQKAEAIALYQAGEQTLEQLATRFGRTSRAMSALFAKAGVKKGEKRAEVQAAVTQQVNAQIMGDAGVIAAKIKETKDSHYAAAKVIAGLIQKQLVNAQQQNKPFATVQNEIKTLKLAAEALATLRGERFVLLGIADGEKDDNNELPELGVHEMTAEQIIEMQSRQDDGGLDMSADEEAMAVVLPSPAEEEGVADPLDIEGDDAGA